MDSEAPRKSSPLYTARVLLCPFCPTAPLQPFDLPGARTVEHCPSCHGLFLQTDQLTHLLYRSDWFQFLAPHTHEGCPCPACPEARCVSYRLTADSPDLLFQCPQCQSYWLPATAHEPLRNLPRPRPTRSAPFSSAPPAPPPTPSGASLTGDSHTPPSSLRPAPPDSAPAGATSPSASPAALPSPRLFVSPRIRFERGLHNLLGVPVALLLGLLFSLSELGQLLAHLLAMPFHELGHALASWLTSRFAVPLPFFTIWSSEQSAWVGLCVALCSASLLYFSWREKSRFGMFLGGLLLLSQAVLSLGISTHQSLMVQILSGNLGEIYLSFLLLIAFHFPLPDAWRWDFWRWLTLPAAGITAAHAGLLWHRGLRDISSLPWGSAIGSESDGDLNRLVNQFDWNAEELTRLYLTHFYLGIALLLLAWIYAFLRFRRSHSAKLQLAFSTAPHELLSTSNSASPSIAPPTDAH